MQFYFLLLQYHYICCQLCSMRWWKGNKIKIYIVTVLSFYLFETKKISEINFFWPLLSLSQGNLWIIERVMSYSTFIVCEKNLPFFIIFLVYAVYFSWSSCTMKTLLLQWFMGFNPIRHPMSLFGTSLWGSCTAVLAGNEPFWQQNITQSRKSFITRLMKCY